MSKHCILVASLAAALVVSAIPASAQESLVEWAKQNGAPGGSSPPGPGNVDPITSGGLVFYSDRASFDAAVPGLPCEDFEEGNVPPGGVVGCPDPIDENSNTACFVPADILPGIQFASQRAPDPQGIALLGAGFFGNASKCIVANFFVDYFDVNFPNADMHSAGMDLHCYFPNADTVNIDIFGPGNVLLGSTTATCNNAGSFFGVISTTPADPMTKIRIFSPLNSAEGVDNICFGQQVPVELMEFESSSE